jgi:hypothetical protein
MEKEVSRGKRCIARENNRERRILWHERIEKEVSRGKRCIQRENNRE